MPNLILWKGELPNKKTKNMGVFRVIMFNRGFNSCLAEVKKNLKRVEIDEKEIIYLLYSRNSLGIRLHEGNAEAIAQAIVKYMEGK